MSNNAFQQRKASVLAGLEENCGDKSRKGSVDVRCLTLVELINEQDNVYTTSTCSGRISVFGDPSEETRAAGKKGGAWVFASHDPVTNPQHVLKLVKEGCVSCGRLVMRFEPFILHAECDSVATAAQLLHVAKLAGFRESGLTLGGSGQRAMVGVRCSLRLEAPVADHGVMLVPDEHVLYLLGLCNEKFDVNTQRIAKLEEMLRTMYTTGPAKGPGSSCAKRRKGQHQAQPHPAATATATKASSATATATATATKTGTGTGHKGVMEPGGPSDSGGRRGGPGSGRRGPGDAFDALRQLQLRQQHILDSVAVIEKRAAATLSATPQHAPPQQHVRSAPKPPRLARKNTGKNTLQQQQQRPPAACNQVQPSPPTATAAARELPEGTLEWRPLPWTALGAAGPPPGLIPKDRGPAGASPSPAKNDLTHVVTGPDTPLALTLNPDSLQRWGHASVTHRNRLLLIGGYGGEGSHTRRSDVLMYDAAAANWAAVVCTGKHGGMVPEPRMGHVAALMGDNHAVLIGGRTSPANPMSDVWLLDLSTWEWSRIFPGVLRPAVPACTRHAPAGAASTVSSAINGHAPAGASTKQSAVPPDSSAWPGRFRHAAVAVCRADSPTVGGHTQVISGPAGACVVVFGGVDGSHVFDDLWGLLANRSDAPAAEDGLVWSWVQIPGGCVQGPNRQGSEGEGPATADTLAVLGQGPPCWPSPRKSHAMAAAGGTLYLHGGTSGYGEHYSDMYSLCVADILTAVSDVMADAESYTPTADLAKALAELDNTQIAHSQQSDLHTNHSSSALIRPRKSVSWNMVPPKINAPPACFSHTLSTWMGVASGPNTAAGSAEGSAIPTATASASATATGFGSGCGLEQRPPAPLLLLAGGYPTGHHDTLNVFDTHTQEWVELQAAIPEPQHGDFVPVRHSAGIVQMHPVGGAAGKELMVLVGGGAFCFSFGSVFSKVWSMETDLISKALARHRGMVGVPHGAVDSVLAEAPAPQPGSTTDAQERDALEVPTILAKQVKDALKELGWLDRAQKSGKLAVGGLSTPSPLPAAPLGDPGQKGPRSKPPPNTATILLPLTLAGVQGLKALASMAHEDTAHVGGDALTCLLHAVAQGVCLSRHNLSRNRKLVISPAQAMRQAVLQLLGATDPTEVTTSTDPTEATNSTGPTETTNSVGALVAGGGVVPLGAASVQLLLDDLPSKWERLGDLALIPAGTVTNPLWKDAVADVKVLWSAIAAAIGVTRLARQAAVANSGTRDSRAELLLGDSGWVSHKEGGVIFQLDVTKCMFSSGNVTERTRMGRLVCDGETLVDLYTGIGYFTVPLLKLSGITKSYACEWNPNAIEALRCNLKANGVEQLCTVLPGDSYVNAPVGVADRVLLGLLPSSEGGWPAAVAALKPTGGWLHVHENVVDKEEDTWAAYCVERMQSLVRQLPGRTAWRVLLKHKERVKWYGPHIRHLVLDLHVVPSTAEDDAHVVPGTAVVGTHILPGTAEVSLPVLPGTAEVGTHVVPGTAGVGDHAQPGTACDKAPASTSTALPSTKLPAWCQPVAAPPRDSPSCFWYSRPVSELQAVERLSGVTARQFSAQLSPARQPVILEGLDIGPAPAKWSPEYLSSLPSSSTTKVSVHVTSEPDGCMDFVHKNFKFNSMSLSELVESIQSTGRADSVAAGAPKQRFYLRSIGENPRKDPANMGSSFPELAADIKVPSLVPPDSIFSTVLRMGSPGLRLWTHYDVMDNVLIQVRGSKDVLLWPPRDHDRLYIEGSSSPIIHLQDPDLSMYPRYPEAVPIACTLHPGDVLFIPSLWFHNVRSLGEGEEGPTVDAPTQTQAAEGAATPTETGDAQPKVAAAPPTLMGEGASPPTQRVEGTSTPTEAGGVQLTMAATPPTLMGEGTSTSTQAGGAQPSISVNVFWRHLDPTHYEKKDLYGNRDLVQANAADKAAHDAVKQLEQLDQHYKQFYGRRLVSSIEKELGLMP